MIAVTIINILAVIFIYISKYKNLRYCYEIAIIILIVFYGIRYNYGNDYGAYSLMFQEINSYQSFHDAFHSMNIEKGWIILNRLFAPLGFYTLVFCLTVFQFGVPYFFFKKYVKNVHLTCPTPRNVRLKASKGT